MAISTRKKKTPAARRRGSKITGPSFAGWESWSGAEYHLKQQAARTFYYENFQPADLMADAWAWMKENDYSSSDIAAAKAFGVSVNCAITCKLLRIGMPDYNPTQAEHWESSKGTSGTLRPSSVFVREQLEESIKKGKEKVIEEKAATKKKSNSYVPSIQDRVRDTAYTMAEPIEEAIDAFMINSNDFDPASYKIAALLRGKGAKAAHARIIKGIYVKDLAEYTELMSAGCPADLMEGYKFYGKKNIKKMFDFLTQISDACDQIAGEAKITRAPRKIKVKSPEYQVRAVKFKASDDRYGIASVPPSQIIGANTVVTFNTKTRKIGIYYADAGSQVMGIKGTSIIGFDEKRSVQKTMRKPELQIKEFKSIGTQKRVTTWFDGIKTTSTAMNGRINADVMILKAWK